MPSLIAACPNCKTRYRVDEQHMTDEAIRLRCKSCESIFRVYAPNSPFRPSAVAEALERGSSSGGGETPRIVIGDADPEVAKQVGDALARWGIAPILVHDGVEAILTIQREWPRAAILDAGLPSMSGAQICELMKRNESLSAIPIALVGSDRSQTDVTASEFSADISLDRPSLTKELGRLIRGLGVALPEGALDSGVEGPASEPPASEDPALDEARGKAARLARVVVSDLVLYNEPKFKAAVIAGNVLDAMGDELATAKAHFQSRVDPRVDSERDYLREELLRQAEKGKAS